MRGISAAKARPCGAGLRPVLMESADGLSEPGSLKCGTRTADTTGAEAEALMNNYGAGFPNSNGGRTTDGALFHALGNAFVGSWISGFRVRQASLPA